MEQSPAPQEVDALGSQEGWPEEGWGDDDLGGLLEAKQGGQPTQSASTGEGLRRHVEELVAQVKVLRVPTRQGFIDA